MSGDASDTKAILRTLESIDRRLALLTMDQEQDVRRRLERDLLKTAARVRMFTAIDGNLGSPELAKLGGVSDRAAQQFIKELIDLQLVRVVGGTTGRGFRVERDEVSVLRWYSALEGSGE